MYTSIVLENIIYIWIMLHFSLLKNVLQFSVLAVILVLINSHASYIYDGIFICVEDHHLLF